MKYVLIRIVFVAFIILTSSVGLFAQFSFGVKGGFNYVFQRAINNQGSFTRLSETEWGPTFHAGVYGKHALKGRASIGWEVQYSNKGDRGITLAYLTAPLLFQYKVYKKLSIEAGAEFGVLLFTYHEISDVNFNNEFYRKADFGLSFGIHFDITDRLSAGIRYTHGVVNVLSKDFSVTYYSSGGWSTVNFYDRGLRYKNLAFQLSVGYRLNKRKK